MIYFVNLPGLEEMRERLAHVDGNAHLANHLHPLLLKSAGQEKTAEGVIATLVRAIHDYTKVAPREQTFDSLIAGVPRYVEALVDIPSVAEQAHAFFERWQRAHV